MIKTHLLTPVVIREDEQPHVYAAFFDGQPRVKDIFLEATGEVLRIMLKNGLTKEPDRKAIHCKLKMFRDRTQTLEYTEQVGESFPNAVFGANCLIACENKVARNQKEPEHVCSHESRDPKNGDWGGSARITFKLILYRSHRFSIITCIGAVSGLKEWEDLALELGKYYCLKLVHFEDEQVQEILRRADDSVKNDPTGRPEGMSITEYVKMVFDHIDHAQEGNPDHGICENGLRSHRGRNS
jgi:hypothetical protein